MNIESNNNSQDEVVKRKAVEYGFGDDVQAYKEAAFSGALLGKPSSSEATSPKSAIDPAKYLVSEPNNVDAVTAQDSQEVMNELPKDYQERLDNLLNSKKSSSNSFPGAEMFRQTTRQLFNMAEGGSGDDARRHYPGWTNDHFRKLIEDLGLED